MIMDTCVIYRLGLFCCLNILVLASQVHPHTSYLLHSWEKVYLQFFHKVSKVFLPLHVWEFWLIRISLSDFLSGSLYNGIWVRWFYFLICWLHRVFVAEWAFSACGLWGLLLITVCSLPFQLFSAVLALLQGFYLASLFEVQALGAQAQ